jgi:hypothetical protein
VEIGQPPPEQMYGQRRAPVETKRTSRSRAAPGEDEEEANHRREDDGGDEHDEENHGNYCLLQRNHSAELHWRAHGADAVRVARRHPSVSQRTSFVFA